MEFARIVAKKDGVYMERLCPVSGSEIVKIASDHKWYLDKIHKPQKALKPKKFHKIDKGCPKDCGLCECHMSNIHLPVFSITNACNLDCNICFTYNRRDKKYFKTVSDTQKIIKNIINHAGEVELINLTGGEPTLHPDLFDIIKACNSKNIGRITMNTNGIRIAQDYQFAEQIKHSGVQLVFSLNTFDPDKSTIIHGRDITKEKKRALDVLEELNIPTTILSVCIKGINEEDVAEIIHRYFKKEFVRGITIQNMTFTGLRGSQFQPREHITIDEVERLLTSKGDFSMDDFFPLGCYHPLCYSVAYYIVCGERILPLSKLIPKEMLTEFSESSYLLDAKKDFSLSLRNGIDKLWAEGEDNNFINIIKKFISELYPQEVKITPRERRQIAEKMIKMIYIHSHMDEDNFDIDRVSRCGDIVPDESGRMIPACSYNLLYRRLDSRFWVEGQT